VTVADPAESRLRAGASLKLAIMDLDARSTGPLRECGSGLAHGETGSVVIQDITRIGRLTYRALLDRAMDLH
jgi:hypothetical protein